MNCGKTLRGNQTPHVFLHWLWAGSPRALHLCLQPSQAPGDLLQLPRAQAAVAGRAGAVPAWPGLAAEAKPPTGDRANSALLEYINLCIIAAFSASSLFSSDLESSWLFSRPCCTELWVSMTLCQPEDLLFLSFHRLYRSLHLLVCQKRCGGRMGANIFLSWAFWLS